jgi:predicted nucleic acid-binding protein
VSRGWLLDTNVVSELAKGARGNKAALHWLDRTPGDELYLSVITLGEIAKGIGLAEKRGFDMRGPRAFLGRELPARFSRRILAFDAEAALAWGRILQGLRGNRDAELRLAVDAQIAAIAEVADLTVCSRNRRDFAQLGVAAIDPFNPA